MRDLIVTTIQSDLFWESPGKNLEAFEFKLNAIENKTDVIVLPEMFTTGFTMNSVKLAEEMEGYTVTKLKMWAKDKDCLIIGTLIIKENNKHYNRLVCAFPNGSVLHYDKRHLFRMAKEDDFYSSGNDLLTFKYKDWNICPLICYDLRFPVWSRNKTNVDLYIYVANWPYVRVSAWDKLLQARAIENLAYVVGVNRIGKDGKGIEYSGGSCLVNYKGGIMAKHNDFKESIITISLSKNEL